MAIDDFLRELDSRLDPLIAEKRAEKEARQRAEQSSGGDKARSAAISKFGTQRILPLFEAAAKKLEWHDVKAEEISPGSFKASSEDQSGTLSIDVVSKSGESGYAVKAIAMGQGVNPYDLTNEVLNASTTFRDEELDTESNRQWIEGVVIKMAENIVRARS
jgi:hypothetical protein